MNYQMNTFAKAPDIELLISGEDEKPRTTLLGSLEGSKNLQLWHYSGGYWGCMDEKIYNSELGMDLLEPEKLAEKLKEKLEKHNKKVEIKVTLTDEQYQNILKEDSVKVFCKSKKVDPIAGEEITLTKLFNDLEVKLIGKDVIISGYPKFYFLQGFNYQSFNTYHLDVKLPIVDPAYGQNVYAIYSKGGANWGSAAGYMSMLLGEEFNPAPVGTGLIAPSQIVNSHGYLIYEEKDGLKPFSFNCTHGNNIPSEFASIGYGTFSNGGAVGISMNYPVTVEIYAGSYPNDIEVLEETVPSSKMIGSEVVLGIDVKSTYGIDLENIVDYTWEIKDSHGTPIDATYIVNGITGKGMEIGTLERIEAGGNNILYASFIMPDTEVNYKLEADGSAIIPKEADPDNNKAEGVILPTEPTFLDKEFVLDYNILSRDFRFQVPDTPSTATVTKPGSATWSGNGTGNFYVNNMTTDLFRNYFTEGAGNFSIGSSSVSKQPTVNTSIQRTDFGDDPIGYDWLTLSNPFAPVERNGTIDYGGTFSRSYYTEYEDEYEIIHRNYSTTSSDFSPGGSMDGNAKVYIYNGMENVPEKTYINEITNNTTTSLIKNLAWESEPYTFDVIRWMYEQDINGNLYNEAAVNGQYDRVLTRTHLGLCKVETKVF